MNNINFTYSRQPDGVYKMNFKPVSRPVMDWSEELDNTAKNIRKLTTKPLFLSLSGGIDSEVMARVFLRNNIEFTAIILRHTEKTNLHDVTYADKFCKDHGIRSLIIDFDVKNFMNVKIPEYMNSGYNTSWRMFRFQQIYLFELAERLNGTIVLGGGEQQYFCQDNKLVMEYKSDFYMCLEWLERNNKLHFPYFFKQNPEVFAAYMKVGLIDFLLTDPLYFVNVHPNTSFEKITVYHRYFPEMERRKKYDGFENVKKQEWFQNHVAEYKKKVGELKTTRLPVSTVKQQLGI